MTPLKTVDLARLIGNLFIKLPGLFIRPKQNSSRTESYQLDLLKRRLEEARNKVPLYKNRNLPEAHEIKSLNDWSKLPLVTKQDLLAHDPSYRLNPSYPVDDLILSKSSGSTGQALDVYYDRESFYTFVLAGLRLYMMAFYYWPWRKQTYIYTSPYPFDSLFGFFPMRFISTLTPIEETLKQLRASPPDLLVCYPSHLRALIDQMSPEDFKKIRPIAVNVNSEMSSSAERSFFSEKLSSFVFDDYSSEELTRIASQCRHLNYHLFDDINYMEVVDDQGNPVDDGTVGNLVGSNLHNRAMPLLRYMQGDRGAIRKSNCACGRSFRILEKLEGRKNDSFVLPDGRLLSSGFLLDLTYEVFLHYGQSVRAFCLVQETPEVWNLELVPGAQWSSEVGKKIQKDLVSKLGEDSVTLEIKIVAQVTRTASGKANPIISRVRKS
jgi:phenylacetate-CoA ligase